MLTLVYLFANFFSNIFIFQIQSEHHRISFKKQFLHKNMFIFKCH